MRRSAWVLGCVLLLGGALLGAAQESQQKVIKFATLAPEGSVWAKALRRCAAEIKAQTNGSVLLKVYPGGVGGDESEVVRKMRLGQFQAAGMTGVGLSEILPEIIVLELPLLFKDGAEVDFVLDKTWDLFSRRFAEKGFRLLGMTETGFVHFYSQVPLRSLADFQSAQLKPWVWEKDAMREAFFAELGMHPVPLGVPDVLANLQSGVINNCNTSPAAAVALQWHTKATSMTSDSYWWISGGIVVTDKAWSQLTPEEQAIVTEVTSSLARELRGLARSENAKAFEALKANGIELVPPLGPEDRARLEQIATKLRDSLAGRLYPKETLDAVLGAIAQYQAQSHSTMEKSE